MNFAQINFLRLQVKCGTIAWRPDPEEIYVIKSVPDKMMDPDRTGIPDYIAILQSGGHIDLSDVPFEHFVQLEPVFAPCGKKGRSVSDE